AIPKWIPPPPLTVIGRVVDANGAAVPGAEIWRVPRYGQAASTADIAGRFEVKLTKPWASLQARAVGHLASIALPVNGTPGGQTTLELALCGPAVPVTVHVVSATDATALSDAVVRIGDSADTPVSL